MEYAGLVDSVIQRAMKQESEALERLCEQMLTTPNSPGISVQREFRFNDYACSTTTRLDPSVPFGEIHYLPDVYA